MTKRNTPGLDYPDQVKYIVRSLFPHVEPFQIQDQSSCVVRREELKRAGGRLKANTAPGILQRLQVLLVLENGLSEN